MNLAMSACLDAVIRKTICVWSNGNAYISARLTKIAKTNTSLTVAAKQWVSTVANVHKTRYAKATKLSETIVIRTLNVLPIFVRITCVTRYRKGIRKTR